LIRSGHIWLDLGKSHVNLVEIWAKVIKIWAKSKSCMSKNIQSLKTMGEEVK